MSIFAAFLAASSPIVPSGTSFQCDAIRVWDGDGPILCAGGVKIRLHNIAAREIDGSCRPGHPCPKASGIAARDHLVKLLGGERGRTSDGHIIVGAKLTCQSYGWAKGSRTAAECSAPGVGNISAAMVRDGYAARWAYRR